MNKISKNTRSIIAFLLAAILIIQPFSAYIDEVNAAEEEINYNIEAESEETSDAAATTDETEITEENSDVSEQSEAEDQMLTVEETTENDSETDLSDGTSDETESTDVDFSDSAQAGADQLTIAENKSETLDLQGDTTYTAIVMESESTLIANTNGHTLTVTNGITGTGAVTLNGNDGTGTVVVGNTENTENARIETYSLTLNNVTVNAQNGSVTATDSLSIKNSTVNNVSLVGYADDVTGAKTIELENAKLSNVNAFGVSATGKARVSYDSSKFASTANSTLYQDYALTYSYNGNTLGKSELGDAYVDSYRVKTESTTNTIVGYHTSNDAYEEASSIKLPTYTETGYTYVGWYMDGAETPVTEITDETGVRSLSAALQAEAYTITLDLGYVVTSDTNDDSMPTNMELNADNQTQTLSKNPNETVTLPTPQRFGYEFQGWTIKNTSKSFTGGQDYTVDVGDSDADKQIVFEAQWKAKSFGRIRFDVGTVVPVDNIKVGEQTIEEYVSTNGNLSWSGTTVILCDADITYGESLKEYLEKNGLVNGIPTLTDSRTGAEQTAFSGWETTARVRVSNDSTYAMGSLISKPTTETLKEYQDKMMNTLVVIQARWGTQVYRITGLPDNDNWSYVYQAAGSDQKTTVEVKEDNGVRYIEVPQGSTVTFSSKTASDETISQWSFTAQDKSKLMISQEKYTGGSTYNYTFTMPACDVEAFYAPMPAADNPVYVNIADSPITFAESISFKGRSGLSGFWYQKYMIKESSGDMTVNAMTPLFYTTDISNADSYTDATGEETDGYYFYAYNFGKYPFYVTSKNQETQNQLILVNQAEIHLKNCNLTPTNTFNEKAVGLNLGKQNLYDFATKGTLQLSEYGNIVIDRSKKNFEATIQIAGENTVGCISTNVFSTDSSYYNSVNVEGTSNTTDSLTLGAVLGSFAVNFKNLSIHQYDKTDKNKNFQPIVAVMHRGDSSNESRMSNCILDAKDRSWCGTYRTYFTESQIDIQEFPELYYYTAQPNYNNSKVHVYGDMNTQFSLVVQGNTSMTVDGSLVQRSQNYTHTDTINTTGTVLVKGNRCDLGVLRMTQGTLISNQLMVSQYSEFSGGIVVTNLLSERADYTANTVEKNADGYPFARSVSTSNGTFNFTFSGSKIYLFGYYKTVENGNYDAKLDTATTVLDADNPVQPFAGRYLGDNAENAPLADSELASAVKDASANAKDKECVSLGKTEYSGNNTLIRNVKITGGSICAAGNITFYNDTTISGGTVTAYGSLASKRDLYIQGGTVTAKEVGNAYNASRIENENERWAQTVITGGNVKTDRIGALTSKIRGVEARSYVTINKDKATMKPFTDNGKIALSSDLKVNYHFLNGLKVDDDTMNPSNVRYLCSDYNTSQNLEGQLKLSESDDTTQCTFANPKDTDDTECAWTYDSVQGTVVQHLDNNGHLNGDAETDYVYSTKKTIELYSVKSQNTLTISEGEDKIQHPQVTIDSNTTNLTFTNQFATVNAGSTVSFSVPASMKDKVIVGYYDDNNVLYNACTAEPTQNQDESWQYSFTMLHTDTTIWVSDAIDLYLNNYPVTFTKDGFATEYGTKSGSIYTFDENRSFTYQGNIRLSCQLKDGEKIERNEDYFTKIMPTSATPLTYPNSATTYNQIHFTEEFDNLSEGKRDRQIILSNLVQKYIEIDSNQTVLEEGAKAWLEIDGHVGLYRVHVPERSDIEISGFHDALGKDGRPQDSLWLMAEKKESAVGVSIGTQTGKCGNITLDNLFLCQKAENGGKMGSNYYTKPVSTLTMKDCTLIHTHLYENTDIAQNLNEVVLDNCRFDIAVSNSWPGNLITNCKKVSLLDGTVYNLKYGSQYMSYSPFTVNRITGDDDVYKNYYKDAEFVIDSSTMNITLNQASNQRIHHSFGWMYQVKLTGTGRLNASRYLSLDKLTMEGNSSVNVGDSNHCGYLFCSDITVQDQASLTSGYIAVSGFDTLVDISTMPNHRNEYISSAEEWRRGIESDTQHIRNGKDYPGLVMNGGTVTASQFVGGDVNGKIQVNDGTLNAKRIGTYGAYMGILSYEPKSDTDDQWCLFYDRVPTVGEAAVVTVTGGTVNVAADGYLGGMNGTVNLTGGKVNLANGAVLGMTDAQREKLSTYYLSKGDSIAAHADTNIQVSISDTAAVEADYSDKGVSATGAINVPYGSLSISGNSKAKIAGIHGLGGTVTIENTNAAYTNPYQATGETNRKNTVGVLITNGTSEESSTNILEAKMIKVAKGARVYASKVRAVVEGQTGGIEIADPTIAGNEGSGIYCNSYLVAGIGGTKDYNNSNGNKQNIFNTNPEIGILYELNPQSIGNEMEDADAERIQNDPENMDSFIYQQKDETGAYQVALKDASCTGYNFDGWYTSADYAEKYDGFIQTNMMVTDQLTLYAKWSKIQVKFAVVIDQDSFGNSFTGNMESEFDGLTDVWQKKTASDNSVYYQSVTPVSVKYGSPIRGLSGINLENYKTNTMLSLSVEFDSKSGYTGTDLRDDVNKVSLTLAEYYKKNCTGENDVILLHVNNMSNRDARITFDLNRGSNMSSVPAFADGSSFAKTIELEVSKTLDSSSLKGNTTEADKSHEHSSGLTIPTAIGYTFYGWNTSKDANYNTEDGWVSSASSFTENTTVYAVWRANTYKVRFQAENPANQDMTVRSFVTLNGSEPAVDAAESVYEDYNWVYDTAMETVPAGWREGYTFDKSAGWKYTYTDNVTHKTGYVTDGIKLNTATIASLNTGVGDADGNPTDVALVLNAEFQPIKVTYHLAGGTMKNQSGVNTDQDAQTIMLNTYSYGDALCGYTAGATTDNNQDVFGEYSYTGSDGNAKSYAVISTKADYYASANAYVTDDYRNALSRKGYTFKGWKTEADGSGTTIGSLPRFADVELYAQWSANTYDLELYEQDNNYKYENTYFVISENAPKSGVKAKVTVGQMVSVDSNWPDRKGDWYAYSDNEANAQKRYLLGFTFASLDPGNSDPTAKSGYDPEYKMYVKATTDMVNGGTLFRNGANEEDGTVFSLPDDAAYRGQIEGSYECVGGRKVSDVSVADYPTGSTIPMYAVYNERSLIFLETYRDPDGNTVSQVKYSGPLATYYNYPEVYDKKTNGKYDVETRTKIEEQGYSLIGWYVNGSETEFAKDKSEYDKNLESYKEAAEKNGTYDVIVNTVFAAVKTQPGITLTANEDPTATSWPVSDSFTIPNSMQDGKLSMQVVSGSITNGLQFVSEDVMTKHLYDSNWGDLSGENYSADNTVAVKVTATSPNGSQKVSGCVDQTGMVEFKDSDGWQVVRAGWMIQLELIHSKVMSEQAQANMTFDLKFCFTSKDASGYNADNNLMKEQWILFDDVKVELKSSMYQVNYSLELPEVSSNLTVTAWNGFSAPQGNIQNITLQVKMSYGTDLYQAPAVVGYQTPISAGKTEWISGNEKYTSLNMDMSNANGQISVSSSYTAKEYTLSVGSQLSDWVISYTDGASGTTKTTIATSATAKVKYHSVITLQPAGNDSPEAAFVTLSMKQDDGNAEVSKLSEYQGYGIKHEASSNTHSLAMLDSDLEIGWNDVQTLYLDNGSIALDAASYQQNKEKHSWPGNYVIWQNAKNDATSGRENGHPENTLTISGDLTGREIKVGNLEITAEDSISLVEDAKATLTLSYTDAATNTAKPSKITAKNILVPAEADGTKSTTLTLQTEVPGVKAEVDLSPLAGKAAIGGSADTPYCGDITVKDLVLNLQMPAGSIASGIGSGSNVSGTAAHTVNVSNCEVNVEEGATPISQYQGTWIGGKTVSAVNITSGSIIKPSSTTEMSGPLITDGSTVTISNSYIGTDDKSVSDPIYAETALNITNSTVNQHIGVDLKKATVSVPIGTTEGNSTTVTNSTIKSVLNSVDYVSDLYSGTMKIMDAKSDVRIGATQIVEISNGSLEINASGYTQGTVTHNHSGSYQFLEEVRKPDTAPTLTIDSLGNGAILTAKSGLESQLDFGKVTVNTDATLLLNENVTTETGDGNKLVIANGKTLTVTAEKDSAYELNLGEGFDATTTGDYIQTNGKLFGSSLVVGGNLTLNNVTANAGSGNLGSSDAGATTADQVTTVTVNGGSVTADVIGAMGIAQKTFTFLKVENDPTWNGKLVQDQYRIAYDNNGINGLNTDKLAKVVRTETTKAADDTETVKTISPTDGVPETPTETDTKLFSCWYLIGENDSRMALMSTNAQLPAGLTAKTSLGAATLSEVRPKDVSKVADGTQTLTVHAWLKATGTATIKKGRFVTAFTDDGAESVSDIPTNGAWTAQLVCTGGNTIVGRDYRVEFKDALPVGTELTIANPVTKGSSTTTTYYRYTASKENVTAVNFSEFTKMGGTDKMSLTADTTVERETFLLSVDYANAVNAPKDGTVKFTLLPNGADNAAQIVLGENTLTYTVTKTNQGTISATDKAVTIVKAPVDKDRLDSQKLFLAAKLKASNAAVKVPFDTEASLTWGDSTITGTWISRDTVLFEIGEYDSITTQNLSGEYFFTGLENGTYQISWSLVYGETATGNIAGNIISNIVDSTYTENYTDPSLTVTTDRDSRVIPKGTETSLAFTFTYVPTSANVEVTVQKQNALYEFESVDNIDEISFSTTNTGATVTFNEAAAGTYRICFSMDENSSNDNVYFTYIVK